MLYRPWPVLVIIFLSGLIPVVSQAADQPQWGQRHSRNMVSDEKKLPDSFDPATGRNVRWSVALGTQTYSTPIIAAGRVFIGTNNDKPRDPAHKRDSGVLLCLDETDGRLHWQLTVPKLGPSMFLDWPHTGLVSPCTVEGNRVYLVSNRNEVMCLDIAGMSNGNDGPYRDEGAHMGLPDGPAEPVNATDADILWLFDIDRELGVHQHDAAHCSILIDGEYLYINTSNGVDDTHGRIVSPDAPSLIVVDKNTGRLVACDRERMAPRTIHCTWSPPSLGSVGARRLAFFGGGDGICYAFKALEPPSLVPLAACLPVSAQAGEPPVRIPVTRAAGGLPASASTATPALVTRAADGLPASAPAAMPTLADKLPVAQTSSRQTVATTQPAILERVWLFDCDPAAPRENVHQYQDNRREGPSNIYGMPVFCDNRIYIASGGDFWHGKPIATLKCIDATGTGDLTRKGEVWSYSLQRYCMSTPAIHDGLAYIGDCGRTVHCVDAATGKACWTQDVAAEVWGSPLVADGKVYVGTRRGELWVFKAGRELHVISTIDLDKPINGTPTAANSTLYIATMNRLWAVGLK